MAPKDVTMYTDACLDYLTCGQCAQEFPLPNITDFINHKTSTCRKDSAQQHGLGFSPGSQEPALSCFICLRDFHTARGVLQHIQFEHNLKIFMQKGPLSIDTPFLVDDKHSASSLSPSPLAQHGTSPQVTTITTTTSNQATTVMHIAQDVTVSSSKKSSLPVMCAKLASMNGATICCSGSECKVIISPPKSAPPPKKCCSSVVPKKRDRHMKEHSAEDTELAHQEQTVLETLASLRGQVLLKQKATAYQSGSECKNPRLVCDDNAGGTSECVVEVDNACDNNNNGSFSVCENDDDDSGMACSDDSAEEGKTQEVQIINIADECITDKRTVEVQPGVTLTLDPKVQHAAGETVMQSAVPSTSHQDQNTDALLEASRESAQILAEMMYQAATQPPMSQVIQGHDLPAHVQPSTGLVPSAESSSLPSFAEPPTRFFTPTSSFPQLNSDPHLQLHLPPFAVGMNPNTRGLHAHNPGPSSLTDRPPPPPEDIHHLPDLDILTPSLTLLQSLEQGGDQHPHQPKHNSSNGDSGGGQRTQDDSETSAQVSRKRRYPTSRPFKCGDCDQAFNQRIHLKKHMSKHTGVKPFKCNMCEYSTVERSHLRAHVRIHTGEKPFGCPHCDYATAQNSTLKIHLKRHHGNQNQRT